MFYGVFCYQEGSLLKSCLRDYGWREASEAHVRLSTRRSRVMMPLQLSSATPTPDVSWTLTPSSRLSPAPPQALLRESSLIVPQQCSSVTEVSSPYLLLALCWLQGEEPCMAA